MKKSYYVILTICFIALISSSCNNNQTNNSNSTITQKENSGEKEGDIKVNLFPQNKEYDGCKTKKITTDEKEKTVNFVNFQFSPYGIYISDLINVVEFEDGTELQLDNNTQTINLVPLELINESQKTFQDVMELAESFAINWTPPWNIKKEVELQGYNEYLGSKINEYGKRNDFFLFFYDNDNSAVIILSYFEEEQDSVLPIFLEEISTIKFID